MPHHPAVLRTTGSREAQLLHAASWHPWKIQFYWFYSEMIFHLSLQICLNPCNRGSKSCFILFSQSSNLNSQVSSSYKWPGTFSSWSWVKNTYFLLDVDILSGAVNSIGGTEGGQAHKQNIPDEEHPHAFNQATKYWTSIPLIEKISWRNISEKKEQNRHAQHVVKYIRK